jgi:iron complex outermembrane receptor protein
LRHLHPLVLRRRDRLGDLNTHRPSRLAIFGFGLAFAVAALALPRKIAHAQPTVAPPPGAITPPEVLKRVEAIYPSSALSQRMRGEVLLAITIGVDGIIEHAEVTTGVSPDLDAAALAAVKQWAFRAARQGDKPVRSRIRVGITFEPPPETALPPSAPTVPVPPPLAPSSAASQDTGSKEAVMDVTVLGRRQPPSRGVADFDVRIEELARVPRSNAAELLKLAPGILLTNEGGEGHAEQVFLRGFDAREGQDIEFSVGGVPINESGNLHGNGYADTHFIIPELVESLRVLEGPFDPRQGNYAVAGSANYELGLAQRGLTAKYTTGSFNSKRTLLLWGPDGESTHTFGGAEIYKSDGFGQNQDSQRASATGQYEGHFGGRGTFRLTAGAYSTNYHSPGVIREDDYRSGAKGFFDTYDYLQGGDASRFSLAGDLESRSEHAVFSQQLFVISRAMRLRENFTGFLLDVQEPIQTPHGQRGDLLDLNVREMTLGARGSAAAHQVLLGQLQELEIGYFARGDSVSASQQRIEASTGHPYTTETSLDSQLADVGLYADAGLRPLSWLTLRGGFRTDLFTFDVNDNCAVKSVSHPSRSNPPGDASCIDQEAFGRHREPNQRASTGSTAFLPRGSLLLGPWRGITASASYGQGVRSVDPNYITQDVKTPFAQIESYEAGVAYSGVWPKLAVVARSSVFQTHVDRDLIFSETAGRNVLGVGTTRTGWLAALRLTSRFFDESANVTLVKSTFDDTKLLVPYVPDVVVRSDTAVFHDLPLALRGRKLRGTLGLGVTYVGRRALPFGQRSGQIFTVDGSTTLSWRGLELGLAVTNLLDRRYRLGEFDFASNFDQSRPPSLVPVRHFTAGAPRAVYLTFAINFGGGS